MWRKRGSAEILGFILVFPLLFVPFMNNIYAYMDVSRYDVLKQVARDAMIRMEVNGGLTEADRQDILNYLQSRNFDTSKVHIDYTPYPVEFGGEVTFRVSYTYRQVRFNFGFPALIQRQEKEEVMVYGPVKTNSKHYER